MAMGAEGNGCHRAPSPRFQRSGSTLDPNRLESWIPREQASSKGGVVLLKATCNRGHEGGRTHPCFGCCSWFLPRQSRIPWLQQGLTMGFEGCSNAGWGN